MRILTAQHSKDGTDNELPYPYLRELLKFDTRETLNVLSLAFMEKEFSTELGFSQRQRIINILLDIIKADDEDVSNQIRLKPYKFKQIICMVFKHLNFKKAVKLKTIQFQL